MTTTLNCTSFIRINSRDNAYINNDLLNHPEKYNIEDILYVYSSFPTLIVPQRRALSDKMYKRILIRHLYDKYLHTNARNMQNKNNKLSKKILHQ